MRFGTHTEIQILEYFEAQTYEQAEKLARENAEKIMEQTSATYDILDVSAFQD